MKKNFLTLATIITISSFINAQFSVGFKAGANFANADLSGISERILPDAKTFTGYTTGVNMGYKITNNLSAQAELNLVQRGFRVSKGFDFNIGNFPIPLGIEVITKVNYLELPLQLKYKFSDGPVQPYVIGGPSLAYATSGSIHEIANFLIDINIGTQNINLDNSNFNRWEAGGRLGAGIAFQTVLGEIQFEGTYYHGFTDFFKDPIVNVHAYNKGFTLQAGWCYNF
ncbi:MAG TPA: porin family protein [Saprospiraceae bacterium]|nr:porin family protein [Saprospiraceae bacterium]